MSLLLASGRRMTMTQGKSFILSSPGALKSHPLLYQLKNNTNDLLFDLNNTESFNIMKQKGLASIFLIWTGLRKSEPLHLREEKSNPNVIFDLGNYSCRHYYSILIKFIYERPKKCRSC